MTALNISFKFKFKLICVTVTHIKSLVLQYAGHVAPGAHQSPDVGASHLMPRGATEARAGLGRPSTRWLRREAGVLGRERGAGVVEQGAAWRRTAETGTQVCLMIADRMWSLP